MNMSSIFPHEIQAPKTPTHYVAVADENALVAMIPEPTVGLVEAVTAAHARLQAQLNAVLGGSGGKRKRKPHSVNVNRLEGKTNLLNIEMARVTLAGCVLDIEGLDKINPLIPKYFPKGWPAPHERDAFQRRYEITAYFSPEILTRLYSGWVALSQATKQEREMLGK